jgi:WD40 repeat protein/tetratricopeptide (TPR) repeat protein
MTATAPINRPSDLRDRVAAADPARRLDLLRQWQSECWQSDDRVPAEELVALLPSAAAEDALVLIWAEVQLRKARREAPAESEYRERFPHLADHLCRQFELEQLLGGLSGSTFPLSDQPAEPSSPPGYEIVGKLGEGAMGVVYRARQLALNRIVALKMMWMAGPNQSERSARFRREAELAARLQHPNIAQVYEFGQTTPEAAAFLAMELVDGPTLAQKCAGVPLPVRDAAALVEMLATAVHYAHLHGVVHRDLKPSNILLTATGAAKIVDFGLAKEISDGPAHTSTGHMLGTPAYMSPEQAAGQNDRVGPATDVWALGAILYELVTGRPPFRAGSPIETLTLVLHEAPDSVMRLRPEAPRDLQTVCLKCLEKDPRRRYATAAALADDLSRFLSGRSVTARPVSVWERGWRWCKRNRPLAASLAAGAGLLLAIAVVSSVAAWMLSREASRANQAEREGRERLFQAMFNDARSLRRSGQSGRRVDALEQIRKATELARELSLPPKIYRELRDEALACLTLADLKRTHTLPSDDALSRLTPEEATTRSLLLDEPNYVAVAPDLTQILCRHPEGGLALYAADTLALLRRLESPPGLQVASWSSHFSPDGRYLAARLSGDQPSVVVWDLRDGSSKVKYARPGITPLGHPFSRDSREFAVHDGTEIVLYESESGEAIQRIGGMISGHEYFIAYDPRAERLAVSQRGVEVFVLDRASGKRTRRIPADGAAISQPTWSDDGQLLAVACNRTVRVYDVTPDNPRLISVLEGHQGQGVLAQFIPGTGLLLSSGWEGRLRLWDPIAGRQLMEIAGGLRHCSSDGSTVVTHDGRRMIRYAVTPAVGCRVLHHGAIGNRTDRNQSLSSVSFDATSTLLATSGLEGVRFWRAARGEELAPRLPLPDGVTALFVGRRENRGLLTFGTGGCLWWPWKSMEGSWVFGPRRPFAVDTNYAHLAPAVTPDGDWVSYVVGTDYAQAVVVRHTADPTRRAVFGPYRGLRCSTLSPDGQWLGVGTWGGRDTLVWEADTGRTIHRVAGGSLNAAFSPDGRRLATREFHGDLKLWDTGDWKPVYRLRDGEGPFAFSADSRLLAVAAGAGRVRILDGRTGTPLVVLETPDRHLGMWHLAFSPNGRYLAAATAESSAVVWDLAALRRGLGEVGLEWDYDPPSVDQPQAPSIRFEGAELAADSNRLVAAERARLGIALCSNPFDPAAHFELGRWALERNEPDRALAHFTFAKLAAPDRPSIARGRYFAAARLGAWSVALADADQLTRTRPHDPDAWWFRATANRHLGRTSDAAADLDRFSSMIGDSPVRLNDFAWELVQKDPAVRDPERGVRLARRAVELAGDSWESWNTLGVGLYRVRDYKGAIEALNRSLNGGTQPVELDLFPLALCFHKLGRHEEARDAYHRATRLTADRSNLLQEVLDLRAEAAAVLGPPEDGR